MSDPAPSGFVFPLPNPTAPAGDAKLDKRDVGWGADEVKLAKALDAKPPWSENGEAPVAAANGDGVAAEVDVVLSFSPGFSSTGFKVLKIDVPPPMAPNGDFSELAKAANPEEANADADVVGLGFSSLELESLDLEVCRLAKGEAAEVFANGFGRDAYILC